MKKSAKIQQANNIKYPPSKKTVSVRPKTQMLQSNITQTRSASRLQYIPQSYPTKKDRMINIQIRSLSPANLNRGRDSHFSDFYSALPALRDSTLFTATREEELYNKRKQDISVKCKLIRQSIENFEERNKAIDIFREKYSISEADFFPSPTLPIKKVEEKMIKIFKERKRNHALHKLQGITKLLQARRIFKLNKKKRNDAALFIQRIVRIKMDYRRFRKQFWEKRNKAVMVVQTYLRSYLFWKKDILK